MWVLGIIEQILKTIFHNFENKLLWKAKWISPWFLGANIELQIAFWNKTLHLAMIVVYEQCCEQPVSDIINKKELSRKVTTCSGNELSSKIQPANENVLVIKV